MQEALDCIIVLMVGCWTIEMRRRMQELDLAFYAVARVDGIEIVRSEPADFDVNLGVRW